ncbi:MAG: YeeE/YedE family protein [Bdellovibrionaceae bacterium]|nr:YeeE/YedE family protein [Pseudobdellovibrionaceae bacterium]
MKTEWMNALYGGVLIGLSASLMLLWNGRVTGISGILYGLISSEKEIKNWRLAFLLGLVMGGFILGYTMPQAFQGGLELGNGTVIIAGLLVGFGTVLGSGCTSGHGVCGISRLSLRSFVATCLFVGVGIFSVYVFKNLGILP